MISQSKIIEIICEQGYDTFGMCKACPRETGCHEIIEKIESLISQAEKEERKKILGECNELKEAWSI